MTNVIRTGSFYLVESRYFYKLQVKENYEYRLKNIYYKYIYGCSRLSL